MFVKNVNLWKKKILKKINVWKQKSIFGKNFNFLKNLRKDLCQNFHFLTKFRQKLKSLITL